MPHTLPIICSAMAEPDYSFVIPVYNESETLPELERRLVAVFGELDGPAEAILIDDGSSDGSAALALELARRDDRFKIVRLSRNFGHQIAVTAGIDHAAGNAVIVMDGDLQDPPEVVLEMAKLWREGFDVVYGVREHRKGESVFKRATAAVFYRLLRRVTPVEMPADVGDFRLVDRRAVDAFKALRESNRYVRGMFSWIGFRQTGVLYARDSRYAGATKYPLRRMWKFALDALVSFSNLPLRLALALGFVVSTAAFAGAIITAALKLSGAYAVPGWASLLVAVSFLGGAQLVVLGMIGLYVGRIYDEVKRRPLYVVQETFGLDRPAP